MALTLAIWTTLPFLPFVRDQITARVGRWPIAWFTGTVLLALTATLLHHLWVRHRLRDRTVHRWLIGLAAAYGLALVIYGAQPVEQTHLLTYGVLGVLIFRALSPPVPTRRAHVIAVLAVFALGWADELLQGLVGRHRDAVVGVLASWLDAPRSTVEQVFQPRYYDPRDIRLNFQAGLLGQLVWHVWITVIPRALARRAAAPGARPATAEPAAAASSMNPAPP